MGLNKTANMVQTDFEPVLLQFLSITLLIFTQPHPFLICTHVQLSPFAPMFPSMLEYLILYHTHTLSHAHTHFMALYGQTHPTICTDCVVVCGKSPLYVSLSAV